MWRNLRSDCDNLGYLPALQDEGVCVCVDFHILRLDEIVGLTKNSHYT